VTQYTAKKKSVTALLLCLKLFYFVSDARPQ
jgi:hypothetical protein